jgi:hypothetical protein
MSCFGVAQMLRSPPRRDSTQLPVDRSRTIVTGDVIVGLESVLIVGSHDLTMIDYCKLGVHRRNARFSIFLITTLRMKRVGVSGQSRSLVQNCGIGGWSSSVMNYGVRIQIPLKKYSDGCKT